VSGSSPTERRLGGRGAGPLACALAVLACLLGLEAAAPGPAAARAHPRPNIILIQTDDQNVGDLNGRTMPRTMRYLVDRGTSFTHYVVSTPQCCPSRAELLTGDYAHNNGVVSNDAGYSALVAKEQTLPVWLKRAGYVTAHVGKYLNSYGTFAPLRVPAPGWDEWFTVGDHTQYYGYGVGVNGHVIHKGQRPRDYVTEVLNRRAVAFVRRHARARRPFYLQLDQRAPHNTTSEPHTGRCRGGAPIPAPGDRHAFRHASLPRPPSFDEADVSDKPSFISSLPLLNRHAKKTITRDYRCRLASLVSVDRGVGEIVRALRLTHALSRTVLIFTSDNGFFEGEHRIKLGKVIPYQEAIHQPLVVRLPRAYRGAHPVRSVKQMTGNVDLAPTILKLAGADPCTSPGSCRTLDGRSLVPLLRGKTAGWPSARGILVEYSGGAATASRVAGVCRYFGVERQNYTYMQYLSIVPPGQADCQPTDQRELYDLAHDPDQLENLYPAPVASGLALRQAQLANEAAALRDCAGIPGRDPLPPSGHYCE
jgi:N-acetylglucosamine-6-sulfatase